MIPAVRHAVSRQRATRGNHRVDEMEPVGAVRGDRLVPAAQRGVDVVDKLLRRMGAALWDLGRGAREITEPLPDFSVVQVKGLSSALWLRRTRAPKLEDLDLRGRGRRSPSSVPDRLYLRAQCVSWDGQVVVSVFVHAALEAGELHLTVRPHVMTPLYNELRVTDASLARRGTRLFGWLIVQTLLDAAAGPLALWRFVARLGRGLAEQTSATLIAFGLNLVFNRTRPARTADDEAVAEAQKQPRPTSTTPAEYVPLRGSVVEPTEPLLQLSLFARRSIEGRSVR
ncbi:hypothetical protein [Streptomyces sp. NPDC017964]|uniref:hypothetical protein n=1 Tax=Streptomyces sp. NPDC017964 TaxID=3365022 RepID=UPI0037A973E5